MPSDVYDHEAKGYTEGLQKPRDIAKKDLTVS
jgi:hypothetical protein